MSASRILAVTFTNTAAGEAHRAFRRCWTRYRVDV
jgi:superfamily I DNA/RNA helicase